MMKFPQDERMARINGQVSFFVLMLTHIAMTGVILYRLYVRKLDELSITHKLGTFMDNHFPGGS